MPTRWLTANLQGSTVLEAQRLQRMADGVPQVCALLEGHAETLRQLPARERNAEPVDNMPVRTASNGWGKNLRRLSGSDNVVIFTHGPRKEPVSDLNSIRFVIGAGSKISRSRVAWLRHIVIVPSVRWLILHVVKIIIAMPLPIVH